MNLQVKITAQLLILNGMILLAPNYVTRYFGSSFGTPLLVVLVVLWLWNLRKIIVELKPRALALNIKFVSVFLVLIPYLGIIIALWLGRKLSAPVSSDSIEIAKKSGSGNFRTF